MPFITLVKYYVLMQRCGYWIIRTKMIKEGASLEDVATVLVWRLNGLATAA